MKRMLTTTATDPARRARFVEEAQVTRQLEHPNIVPVYELTRQPDGTVYYTMKLVKGKSLADTLKEGSSD
jgi:serine/threonine protein kinase